MANGMRETTGRSLSIVSLLAGIWTILSPYIYKFTGTSAASNSFIVGALIIILAVIGMTSARATWTRVLNILLGAWLFISAFFSSLAPTTGVMWNNLIVGAIVVIFAAWGAGSVTRYTQVQPR